MKRILVTMLLTTLLLVSCDSTDMAHETSETSVETVVTESSESAPESSTSEASEVENSAQSETAIEQAASVHTTDVDLSAIGGDTIQWDYNTSYTNIDRVYIAYVGDDLFQEWVGEGYNPNVNLQTFIQEFGLSKEEFQMINEQTTELSSLPQEKIDALFSGDQAAINRIFASDFAAVSESGDIYTIFWLAEHNAADYQAAGLSADAVASAIENCQTLGIEAVDAYCTQAQTALTTFEAEQ